MPAKQRYQVKVGLNYPPNGMTGVPEQRAEPGSVVDDISEASLGWLIESGCIEPTSAPLTRAAEPDPQAPAEEVV